MKSYIYFLCMFFLIYSHSSYADESVPLLFTRSNIIIARSSSNTPPLPWQKPEDVITNAKLSLEVEVRDAATLYSQKGWYNLSSPSELGGVLLVFSSPTLAPIVSSEQYAPLDVLMINDKGIITSILPNLMLSELSEELYPNAPILAFLFLKGGSCEKLSIRPGDEIEYKLFKKPPTILTLPENTPSLTNKSPANIPTSP